MEKIKPILQALLVTFLWSTSFVIIKLGLLEIPPLVYAGLRYFLAFLCFIPIVFGEKYKNEIKSLTKDQWIKLILLGVVFYTFTQGAQFLGLFYLPSVTVSLMLNFTPIVVAVSGIYFLKEIPSGRQWTGVIFFVAGILIYFYPVKGGENQITGLIIMAFGVLANAGSAILGRNINRKQTLSPVVITFVSMGTGAVILLITGVAESGIPVISLKSWGYLLWLAVVNTAFAFTLWNHTLRSLTAMESSIINGTMLIQIAILAWIFLGEAITIQEGAGMLVAAAGALLVQLKKGVKN